MAEQQIQYPKSHSALSARFRFVFFHVALSLLNMPIYITGRIPRLRHLRRRITIGLQEITPSPAPPLPLP